MCRHNVEISEHMNVPASFTYVAKLFNEIRAPLTMEAELNAKIDADPNIVLEKGTEAGIGNTYARISASRVQKVNGEDDEGVLEFTAHSV